MRYRPLRLVRFQAHSLTLPLPVLRHNLLTLVRAALRAVDAGALVSSALAQHALTGVPTWLIAVGKAAPGMAAAASATLGPWLRAGVVIAPAPCRVPAPLESMTGEHPEPQAGSLAAGARALEIARAVRPDEQLLVLISGGASALMAAPANGLALEDKGETTRLLLQAGADIRALNTVRKHLSAIKGGWLAAVSRGRCWTLAISDVIGDDLSVIGSGPTVADPTDFAAACGVLQRFGGLDRFPPAVSDYLAQGALGARPETPKPGDPRLGRSLACVIGGRMDAMRGAASEARALGCHVLMLEQPVSGDARTAGRRHLVEALARAQGLPRPLCVVSSGETTVTVTGRGRGGRNQEFTLATVEALAAVGGPIALASVGTDGVDGPTDAAGAVADSSSLARAVSLGLAPPAGYLADNDSYSFFAATGDLVQTGPTGTNVGDLQLILLA